MGAALDVIHRRCARAQSLERRYALRSGHPQLSILAGHRIQLCGDPHLCGASSQSPCCCSIAVATLRTLTLLLITLLLLIIAVDVGAGAVSHTERLWRETEVHRLSMHVTDTGAPLKVCPVAPVADNDGAVLAMVMVSADPHGADELLLSAATKRADGLRSQGPRSAVVKKPLPLWRSSLCDCHNQATDNRGAPAARVLWCVVAASW
jgi:hypothetical protein